jgi:hypothetical protein
MTWFKNMERESKSGIVLVLIWNSSKELEYPNENKVMHLLF